MYITLAQLALNPGAKELAEVATPEHLPIVNAELMHARLMGFSLNAWADNDVAACDQAVLRVNAAVNDAVNTINGFLASRLDLPLQHVPEILTTWCRAIVRYNLHINRLNADDKDPITRNYTDAIKLLRLTADGKFSLGVGGKSVSVANTPEFTEGQSTFRDALRDY